MLSIMDRFTHHLIIWLAAFRWPAPTVQAQGVIAAQSPPSASLWTQAATLFGLTGVAYSVGRWRERMYNAEHNVAAEVARQREETNRNAARVDQRLTAIEGYLAAAAEQRVTRERWEVRVQGTLENIDGRQGRMERKLESLTDGLMKRFLEFDAAGRESREAA